MQGETPREGVRCRGAKREQGVWPLAGSRGSSGWAPLCSSQPGHTEKRWPQGPADTLCHSPSDVQVHREKYPCTKGLRCQGPGPVRGGWQRSGATGHLRGWLGATRPGSPQYPAVTSALANPGLLQALMCTEPARPFQLAPSYINRADWGAGMIWVISEAR